jgi:hypothetical protein
MNTYPPPRPVTLHKAARSLGLPIDWLREEASAGRVPCLRAGDRYLFDLEQLRELILDRVRRGDGPPSGEEGGR